MPYETFELPWSFGAGAPPPQKILPFSSLPTDQKAMRRREEKRSFQGSVGVKGPPHRPHPPNEKRTEHCLTNPGAEEDTG